MTGVQTCALPISLSTCAFYPAACWNKRNTNNLIHELDIYKLNTKGLAGTLSVPTTEKIEIEMLQRFSGHSD